MDIYKNCPTFENGRYLMRLTELSDADDLLEVYSDPDAVPFFNSDNCHGDDFYYTTRERMVQALEFWRQAYDNGWFVRFSVIDKAVGKAIGSVEEFKRDAADAFTDCGLLRLDLKSDHEKRDEIVDILSLIATKSFKLFGCSIVATKAGPAATERIAALTELGFVRSDSKLIGHDGTEYADYFVLNKQA